MDFVLYEGTYVFGHLKKLCNEPTDPGVYYAVLSYMGVFCI